MPYSVYRFPLTASSSSRAGSRLLPAAVLAWLVVLLAAASCPAATFEAPGQVGVGQPFLVRMVSDVPCRAVRFTWLGEQVEVPMRAVPAPLGASGSSYEAVVLLGSDVLNDAPGEQILAASLEMDGVATRFVRTVELAPVKYPEQHLNLPPKMVTPPKQVLARITAESQAVAGAKAACTGACLYALPLQRPVEGSLSSTYGLRRVLNGEPRSPHRGLDMRGAAGTPVHAAAAGRVVLVADHYYTGWSVYLDHGAGMGTHYYHLSRVDVHEGEAVAAGQVLGAVGSTGRATGPHLHFGVSLLGRNVDPEPLFTAEFAKEEQ